ncbi:UDP-N-acetylglucosamine 2-epimerase (non-hydrolyzing) [Methanomicrobium sp. W14]|uniref:non-hydrolyzing UDP-N-acetylglucosamine 2-epimerase n=1 Tax=Methanomicrobium sp. W14 TaxID=2817839 RepID=UPI001AE77C96|nr:UDP-N-acetylglucosamine 2-epimerase (non-hydrolyzing) [Methanomicrobium sp. W14]MBP2134353.1 UDP-N-acetylglucosamine 2-epimerase (non-hydrolyzing) [Methanomicrobium sp. W14]
MKIAIVTGTRPEIIKLSPVIRACQKKGINFVLINSGQHYSYEMDEIFYNELKLPKPDYNLEVGSGTHACQTGKIMCRVENILKLEKPDYLIVLGDTNTTLGSALAASKIPVKICHIEAGCRSYNRLMPEEINRVVTDHISDYLFVQSELVKNILLGEGIPENQIIVTGNTVVDSVYQNITHARESSKVLSKLSLSDKSYFLLTLHRQENVDDPKILNRILKGLDLVIQKYGLPVVFPVHPRSKKMIDLNEISVPNGIICIDPASYLDFLMLESCAKLILTDSGGVQFEACVLKVPCVTLREETEIPESVIVGANKIAGSEPLSILNSVEEMLLRNNNWDNPFGKGNSSELILDYLCSTFVRK